MQSGDVVYVVRTFVDSRVEHEWNMWHTNTHIPEVLQHPGFLKATKYRRTDTHDNMPEYWTVYEMQSMNAFEAYDGSEAAKKLRAEHDRKFGICTRIEKFVLMKSFELSSAGTSVPR